MGFVGRDGVESSRVEQRGDKRVAVVFSFAFDFLGRIV
jgi:hypothetical protein